MPTGSEIPASHATLYRLALASIGIGVLVLGLKFLAWRLTGSIALYSDALESLINFATAIAAFVAVRVRAMPAEDKHPSGQLNAEYLSTMNADRTSLRQGKDVSVPSDLRCPHHR